jgi:hypothetical protein
MFPAAMGHNIQSKFNRSAAGGVVIAKKHADHADATADCDAPASEVGQ